VGLGLQNNLIFSSNYATLFSKEFQTHNFPYNMIQTNKNAAWLLLMNQPDAYYLIAKKLQLVL